MGKVGEFSERDDLREIDDDDRDRQRLREASERLEARTDPAEFGSRRDAEESLGATRTGSIEHYQFREKNQVLEPMVPEGPDTFTTERAIMRPDGAVYDQHSRPDFVDYRDNVIIDLKPIHDGESEQNVYEKYDEQIQRYKDDYRSARGVVPEVVLQFYNADSRDAYYADDKS